MKVRIIATLVAALMIASVGFAAPPKKKSSSKRKTRSSRSSKVSGITYSGAEIKLVGVSLYDSVQSLVRKYGSPDIIEALSITVGGDAGGGGGGGGTGGGGGRAAGASRPAARGGGDSVSPDSGLIGNPFADFQAPPDRPNDGGDGVPGGGGPPSNGARGGAGGGGGAASTDATVAQYVRYLYKRDGVRYGFVLDPYGKVVQIESIGLKDAKTFTRHGIKFGSTMADIIKRYDTIDGYEIAGDSLLVRCLSQYRVSFKLARLKPNDKQRVIGIVLAAGKK